MAWPQKWIFFFTHSQASGFRIESAATPAPGYRAVWLRNGTAGKDSAFNGEDGVIVLHGSGASVAQGSTAIETLGSDVALKNVFVMGAAVLVDCPPASASLPSGTVSRSGWIQITLFVLTASGGTVWDRGVPVSKGQTVTTHLGAALVSGVAPPASSAGLPHMHSWDPAILPTWQSRETLDAAADYGATPNWVNDTDDDGAKIQLAIDDACDPSSPKYGHTVFVPHGEFGLARPLNLRGCAALIGAGSHSTRLRTLPHPGVGHACFVDAALDGQGGGMLASHPTTPDDDTKSEMLLVSDMSLVTGTMCTFLDLAAGKLLLRDVGVDIAQPPAPPPPFPPTAAVPSTGAVGAPAAPPPYSPDRPYVALWGGVSGRFYGLPLDGIFGGKDGDNGGPLHVLLFVNGTGGAAGNASDVHFYQPSTEHLVNKKQVLVASCRGVHFHAWKYESALNEPKGGAEDTGSLLWIDGSVDVSVFGSSGNERLYNTTIPMIDIRGSTNVTIVGMVRKAAWNEPTTGTEWLHDDSWSDRIDDPAAGGRVSSGGVTMDGRHQLLFFRSGDGTD